VTIQYVQSTQNQYGNSSSARTLAFGSNVTAGNFLVAIVTGYADGSQTFAVTDSLSQTWSKAILHYDGSGSIGIYYRLNTAGGACTVTVTPSESVYLGLGIAEFSGVLTSSALSGTSSRNTGSGPANPSQPLAPPTGANLMIIGWEQSSTNMNWAQVDSGYTMLMNLLSGRVGGNPSAGGEGAFKINEGSNFGAILTTDGNGFFGSATAAFKGSATGPASGTTIAPLAKVPDKDARRRRFFDLVSDIVNSLVNKGTLSRGDAVDDWNINVQ